MTRTAAPRVAAVALSLASVLADVFEGVPLRYDAYPQVVVLGTDRAWTCSGVLVGANTIVTAAHCLDAGLTRVGIGNDPDVGDVLALDVPPYRAVSAEGEHLDVAAFVLPHDITTNAATFATSSEIDVATAVTVVGFGGRSADSRGGGLKRLGRVSVRVAHCPQNETYAGDCRCVHRYTLVTDAGAACRGDSGGGVFVDGRLAGFVSCFANDDNDCARGQSIIIRADALHEWIIGLPRYRPTQQTERAIWLEHED